MNCTSILVTGGASEQEKKENEGGAGEKRNSSGDVHGIANHSSAETELAWFRERWCHPISTNEKSGEDKCIGERGGKNTARKRS